ncbi:solute carrier family 66 member 2 isoform X2 [Folsomia candida]|uniref:solute carrier family 66 member 2 isoform X2 n=1 Tax=Folsomia candida TaxID=158441 RepID=UPI001605122B|nr:solute carrier family 66 member 2 isoform X2 [Folsomia candida]
MDVNIPNNMEPASTMEMLLSLISGIASLAMIFGGVVPYIPQYNEIRRSGNAEGFSLYVCLALLSANILRILFWFGKPFESPLLIQSVLMNIAMMCMIKLCIQVKAKSDIIKKKDKTLRGSESESDEKALLPRRNFWDFDKDYFWDWTDFQSYIECTLCFSIAGGMLMYMFANNILFVETVGFLAVFVEACLGVPQFMKNYKNGSTRGMNLTMVLMWLCGDVFKTTYFVLRAAPVQFTICGCLQIGVDLAILSQVWVYSSGYGSPPPRVHVHSVEIVLIHAI